MKLGAIITAVTGLLIIGLLIIKKKKSVADDASNKFLEVFEKVYYAGMTLAFTAGYVVPICFTIYNNIS